MLPYLPTPTPDFTNLRKVLLRQGEPARLPLIELLADREMMEAVIGERIPFADPSDQEARKYELDRVIRFWHCTGYDYVPAQARVVMPRKVLAAEDTALLKHSQRSWDDENSGPIMSWEDFERYPWPKPEEIDFSGVEYLSKHLPEGMQIIYQSPGGQFENISELMGVTRLALAIHDDPALVQAIAEKVGALITYLFNTAVDMPNIGALWMSDDLGYKTSTVLSPRHLRQYVFPVHKKAAEIAHAHNMPILLHSCGNLERIMPDLIDDVGFDARHSFEDVIVPVTEAKKRWGSRIALLGGIDMDVLCRSSEEQVRAYTHRVIAECAPGGGYALGTGNTVANYIPVRNYLAMIQERDNV